MPTLRFTQNVPQVIALQFSEGKIKPSSIPGNPDDMQYALATPPGMTAYLPISAAEMIRRAGITARQPFEICKVGKDDYRINTLNGPGRAANAPVAESQVQGNYTNTSPNHTPAAPPPANGNGNRPANPVAPPPDHRVTPQATKLMSCFLSAIDAVAEAQTYATRKGLGITFSSENVTSAALSCFINECRNGGTR
jgi:hypothetical protein